MKLITYYGKEKPTIKAYISKLWSGKRDSNPRPLPWQGNALPAELFPQNIFHKYDYNNNSFDDKVNHSALYFLKLY